MGLAAGSRRILISLVAGGLFLSTTVALAAAPTSTGSRLTDDGAINSGKETHAHDHQHGGIDGHLDPVQQNVDLVGFTDLFAGGEEPGRIGDVSAKGNYAYLTLYREPSCDRGGIQIVDISDPANPKAAGYIPSHLGTYAGEGSQVISLNTRSFKGDVLMYRTRSVPGRSRTGSAA